MKNQVVRVLTFPGVKKEKFVVVDQDAFEAYVREPAQNNLANLRVRELIAGHYGVPVSQVTIRTGHRSRKKTLVVTL